MERSVHYTDEEFQNFFDKSFTGDVSLFENHVKECASCKQTFETYSLIWSFTKNELLVPPLRIDLVSAVANKVFPVKQNRPVFEETMYGLLIGLGLICLILCFNFLLSSPLPIYFVLMIIPVGLFFWVNYKEVKMLEKKFELSSHYTSSPEE